MRDWEWINLIATSIENRAIKWPIVLQKRSERLKLESSCWWSGGGWWCRRYVSSSVSLSISLHYLFSPVSDINEFNYYYYIIVIIRSLSTAALNQKIVNISVAKLSQRQEGSQSVSQSATEMRLSWR